MKLLVLAVAISAIVAVVLSTHCPHGDMSGCDSINCTDDSLEMGCEHDICTCVQKPISCTQISDCLSLPADQQHCKHHDESMHCLDGGCKCV